MTSRERVISAVEHKEPDRIPVDLGSTPSSGISAIAYNNLIEHTGIANKKNKVYDVVQQVTQPEWEVIELFGADVLDVGRTFHTKKEDWYDVELSDGSVAQYPSWFRFYKEGGSKYVKGTGGEVIAKMPEGATFFDQTAFPYLDGYPDSFKDLPAAMDRVLWQKLVHSPWDASDQPGFWEKLRDNALELRASTDKAIMIVCGCNLFEWGTFLRRIDQFLMDLALEPEKVEELLDALMEIHLKTLENVCKYVGDVADIIRFGDDLGVDNGPFMSPDMYRNLFKPRHQKLCEYVKKHSTMKTFLHSCGSIYSLIPDLIEAGYDIINPVQTSAKNMEPERLKREFGKDITFWGGGCDTRSMLNNGTPEQVREHVKRNIEILAPGGGWVFNTVHNIMPDVPPENILAMLETIHQY